MKEKKHIDRLFEESFKNFEVTPSPKVWENIEARLKEKKKERKVMPLWLRLAGIAAMLALLVTLGNAFLNEDNNQLAPLVNQDSKDIAPEKENTDRIFENTEKEKTLTSEDKIEKVRNSAEKNENGNYAKDEVSKDNSSKTDELQKKAKSGIASNSDKKSVNNKDNNSVVSVTSEVKKNTSNKNVLEFSNYSKEEKGISGNFSDKEGAILKTTNNSEVIASENPLEVFDANDNKKSLLEEVENRKEESIAEVVKNDSKRWDIAPNFAPVYYGSLSEGSSIDPTFADNPQSGNINASYGLQVSYVINKKLSIRSGINNLDLSYSTGGIELGTTSARGALQSVNYGDETIVTTALDRGSIKVEDNFAKDGILPKSVAADSRIFQNINYFEVPLELKYAVLDKKFGINFIGGFSTLFLGDNEILVTSDGFEDVLGEANNLTNVSFTTNVGLGFDYHISKRFTFNVEPMFKYQLNPYTDSSVDFKPYYVGVYSGLSFKF